MPRPTPITDAERAELRRLFLAASQGTWEANVLAVGQAHVYALRADGTRWLLAMPNKGPDAELMVAARNALPRLFAEIDELRRRAAPRRTIPILGSVG